MDQSPQEKVAIVVHSRNIQSPMNGTPSNSDSKDSLSQVSASEQVKTVKREQVWMTLIFATIASIPALFVGCTLGFPSAALLDLTELEERPDFKFNSVLSDLFGAMAPLGAIFGGPIAGWIADHLGRKVALITVIIPYLAGYMVISYANLIENHIAFKSLLLIGRFVTGVGLGWSCLAVPVYTAEISSAKLRGVFASFTQLFLSIGLLLIYFLGSFEGFYYYHAALVLIGILAAYTLMVIFIPETPRWLLVHGHKDRAISTLKLLRGKNYDIGPELKSMEAAIANTPHLKFTQSLKELTKQKAFMPLMIILVIMFFQQISGLNASTAYSASIFKEAGVSNYRQTATYAVGVTALVFTTLSMFIVDLLGRKLLLIISGVGMLIGSTLLGAQFYITRPSLCSNSSVIAENLLVDDDSIGCNTQYAPMAIVSLILFNAAFAVGWGPVPWILLGELLPLRIRGTGSGIATVVNWGTAAIVTGFYLDYAKAVRTWFAWWTFSVFNLAGVIFVLLFVFETKGKSLEEIQHRFERKQKQRSDS